MKSSPGANACETGHMGLAQLALVRFVEQRQPLLDAIVAPNLPRPCAVDSVS
jgi:hypothetical protein